MEHAAAQDQVLRVENIQFCGNCAGNFLQEILQDGGRALFREQPAYGQAGEMCVPQMGQSAAGGKAFGAAQVSAAADFPAAAAGNVPQLSRNPILAG